MRKIFFKSMLLLCALIVGSGSLWGAENDTHDFSQTLEQLLNNNATISSINIAAQSYSVKEVIITYRTTQTASKVDMAVSVGSTDFGSYSSEGKKSAGTTQSFTGTATTGAVTIDFTNKSGNGTGKGTFYVTNVRLVEGPCPYEIEAASNDNDYGTVSLAGSVITGAPKPGYRYATPAYSVSPANSATVSQNGNAFTVTPSANTTVTINFEAIPTYTITCVSDPVGAGTFDAASSLYEGGTTNITANANSGYKFKSWAVSGTGASLSSTTTNPTTLTMGTANATVTATFEAVTTCPIHWSVNGSVIRTDNVEKNTAISFPTSISGIPTGYALKGWVVEANKIVGTQNSAPTYATGNAIAEITYYAVMAVSVITPSTWTLDYSAESSLSSSTSWGSYGTSYNYTASDGGTWTIKAYKSSGMQINTGKDASIKIPSCSGDIQSISITCSAAKAVGLSANNYSGSGTITYLAEGTDARSQTLDLSSQSVTNGYIVPKGGSTAITKIIVNYNAVSYTNYCTTVPTATITLAAACTDNEKYYGTYSNSSAFVVPENVTVAEIGIDNEGKLDVQEYTVGDIVPANTGVMISSSTSGSHTVTLAAGGTSVLGANNKLHPSGDAGIAAGGMTTAAPSSKYYRLTMHNGTDIGFWWGAENGAAFSLAANKAYLAVPTGVSAPSRFWIEDEENNATNIENVEANENAVKFIENGKLLILRDGITYDALGRVVR